jgi:hypothetical protein
MTKATTTQACGPKYTFVFLLADTFFCKIPASYYWIKPNYEP